ncbi:MAG: sulfate ester transporter, periplasmic ligand binding protein [Tardiphaga sp.]|nr:sulfate ester transporter, periplasmic ligand binding protein [Tardiphaga sp.]
MGAMMPCGTTLCAVLTSLIMICAGPVAAQSGATAPDGAKPDVIRFGTGAAGPTGRLGSQGVIGIVYAKKFLEEELAKTSDPVKVEWNFFRGAGPATNEALATKAIDFAYYGDFPIIIGRAGGLKIKIIAGGERGAHSYLIVPTASTAKSIEDLKDKRIGLHRGRPWELAYAQLLKSKGLAHGDLQTFNVSQGDAQTGLVSGNVDAIFTGSDGFAMIDQGLGKIIWSTREAPPQWRYSADLVVTDDFEAKYPVYTQKVVDAFVKASLFLSDNKNREEAFTIWSETGLPVANYRQEREGELLKDRNNPTIDDYLIGHYQLAIDHVKEAGLIRRSFPAADLFEAKYVRDSLKRFSLEDTWRPQAAASKLQN